MNRDFLKGLGLESEHVEAIMSRYGVAIAAKEDEITKLGDKVTKLETEITDLQGSGDETLKNELATAKQEKETLENELANTKKQHELEKHVVSLGAKDIDYITAKLSDLELKDGEFVGIEERVNELKEVHPLLFEAEEPQQPEQPTKPKPWSQGNSSVEGGAWTRDKIMGVKDVNERQRLIREHRDLF